MLTKLSKYSIFLVCLTIIYIYYELYIKNNLSEEYLNKLNYYINLIEKHHDYNSDIAKRINTNLSDLKKEKLNINLP